MGKNRIRILIDTDIGDDIDDALAIALALESPEIEIVGITTVYKNTNQRAQLVSALLEAYDKPNIPVYVGIGTPFVHRVDSTEIPKQCEVLTKAYTVRKEIDAVDFIIQTLREDPTVILVPIGAQTNIAVAFLKAPEVMKFAKIIAMGGVFSHIYAEYNIACDPEAAKIVSDFAQDYTMVGLDVTAKCRLGEKEITAIKDCVRPNVRFLYQLIGKWCEIAGNHIMLHDPLVIGYLLDNSLLTMQKIPLRVELNGALTRGITFSQTNPFIAIEEHDDDVQIAVDVNANRFVELFVNRIVTEKE